MKVIVLNDALEISKEASEIIIKQVNKNKGTTTRTGSVSAVFTSLPFVPKV